MEIDESYMRRLASVQALFHLGLENLERGTPYNSAQAVLTFDNALEMMFRLASDKMQLMTKDNDRAYLPALVRNVNQNLTDSQLKVPSITELHEARNKIQHNGILVDKLIVDRYRSLVAETLEYLTKKIFEIDWKTVSISNLIQNPIIRSHYNNAEHSYGDGKYEEAAFWLSKAFEEAKQDEQKRIHGSGILFGQLFVGMAVNESSQDVKSLFALTNLITQEIEILKLRLDYKSYMKFRDLLGDKNPFQSPGFSKAEEEWHSKNPHIVIAKDREFSTTELTKRDEERRLFVERRGREILLEGVSKSTEADLRRWLDFAFDFVMDSILRWEKIKRDALFG